VTSSAQLFCVFQLVRSLLTVVVFWRATRSRIPLPFVIWDFKTLSYWILLPQPATLQGSHNEALLCYDKCKTQPAPCQRSVQACCTEQRSQSNDHMLRGSVNRDYNHVGNYNGLPVERRETVGPSHSVMSSTGPSCSSRVSLFAVKVSRF
jgi:hypothetical protein